jgi:tape measure domain-containing protein
MAGSAGGLYLQVKLDTAAAERQLKSLGRAYAAAVNPSAQAGAASRAAAAQAREIAVTQKAAAATARQAAAEATAAGNVEVNRLKAEAVAAKAAATERSAAARVYAADQATANRLAREAAREADKGVSAERRKTAAQRESEAIWRRFNKPYMEALKKERLERERIAELSRNPAGKVAGIASAGAQDLFVGLGAARSGNVGYGLAAVTRYAQSLTSAAAGASAALVGVTAAIVGIAAVAAVAGIAITTLAKSLLEAGTQGAESFELLRIQLGALLGSAKAGQDEFDFLINLGKTSIIPTESLIQADRTLLSFGVTAQSTRRELVTLFANIGSAFSLTTDQIYFLSLAISQVVAKGKADAVDLRQLANNGIATTKLYESIAKQTGKSVKEIAAEQENGGLSAQLILLGLTGLTKEYQGAADAAAKSAGGLKQNLQDTFSAGLSNAFLKGGALEPIKAFFSSLLDVVGNTKGLFDNLAGSARNLFDAVLGGDTARTSGNFIVSLFRDYIPTAINAFAAVIRGVRPFVLAFVEAVRAGLSTLNDAFRNAFGSGAGLMSVLGALATSAFFVVNSLIAIGIIATSAFSAVISGAQAAAAALVGNFSGAYEYLKQGATSIVSAYLRVQGIINSTRSALKPQAGPGPVKPDNSKLGSGPGSGAGGGAGSADNAAAAAQKAAAAAQKIATARNELYTLLQTYFGRPSDALAGLFGDGAKFTATTDSIVSNAKRIYDAVKAAAPGARGRDIADFVSDQTERLLALAKRRDTITEKLKDANEKLKAVIQERDDFIKQIKDAGQGFVFDLNVDQATNTRAISGPGYAGTSSVTGMGSFAEQVKKRLADYKAFVANIRKLIKDGLDKTLIKQFIQAGPSAAGAVVAQLAGAGAGVIGDLNAAQADLNKLSDEFGVEVGGTFFQAGIDQAKQTVAGLESQLSSVDKAAKTLADAILKRIQPLAKKMKDQGAAAGTGLGSGLGTAFKNTPIDFGDPLKGLFPDDGGEKQARTFVDTLFDSLRDSIARSPFVSLGRGIISSILSGLASSAINLALAGERIANDIVGGFVTFWNDGGKSKIAAAFGTILDLLPGPKVLLGALRGLFSGDIRDFFTSLPGKLGITSIWSGITSTIPSAKGVLEQIKGVLKPVSEWLSSQSFNPWRLLLDGIPSLKTLTSRLMVLRDAFAAVLNIVIGLWNRLDFKVSLTIPDLPIFGPLAGKGFSINDIFPDVKSLASGGIATSPSLAMIGDNKRRPEAVVPLTSQGISTFMEGVGGGGDIAVEARVFIGDRELTDIVRTEVKVIDSKTAIAVAGNRRS